MSNQVVLDQHLQLLEARIDARKKHSVSIKYRNLINIYGEGFLKGAGTTFRTFAIRQMQQGSSAQDFKNTRYGFTTEDQMDYVQNVLPGRVAQASNDLWDEATNTEGNLKVLTDLIDDSFLPITSERLVNLYFYGLEQGIYLGHLKSGVQDVEMIQNETARFMDSFRENFNADSEFMNDVFMGVTAKLNQVIGE